MNAPELLRAGGWRQGHHEGGAPYWEHAERYGTARWDPAAAIADELERVSRDRLREAHGFVRREEALQRQVADLQRIEELAKREPNYQTALEAWSAEIGQRQAAQAELDQALGLLRKAAPALLDGAKELRKVAARVHSAEPHWLLKDFNVLYTSARALADACNGRGDGRPYAPLRALEAQLERLKPAFAETEATAAELARGGGA